MPNSAKNSAKKMPTNSVKMPNRQRYIKILQQKGLVYKKPAPGKHSAEKMLNDEEDGMQKLFRMPDLVDKLLSFLDATSTLCLAQSKISCVLQILQHKTVPWNKMVRRTISGNFKIMWSPDRDWESGLLDGEDRVLRESFKEKRVHLLSLVDIFKMIEGPKMHKLHHLLDAISEKYASNRTLSIRLSRSWGGTRSVSPLGFLLLEEVEGSVGSALQEIVSIVSAQNEPGFLEEPLLSALASRVSRQEQKMQRVDGGWVKIGSKESAQALLTLVENTHAAGYAPGYTRQGAAWHLLGIWMMKTSGRIEAEGWAMMARALALIPNRVFGLIASKELVREGRSADMRTVWESLSLRWHVGKNENYKTFLKSGGEGSWDALELLAGWTRLYSGRLRSSQARYGLSDLWRFS